MNFIAGLIVAAGMSLSPVHSQYEPTEIVAENSYKEWIITVNTTQANLDQMVSEVTAAGGQLDIHQTSFKKGKLKSISLTLASPIGIVKYDNPKLESDLQICLRLGSGTVSAGNCN